jgi:SAM-dependent methyltransferase
VRALDLPTFQSSGFILEHICKGPLRILEVGCGMGELASMLKSQGHEVVAIDSSADAVEAARRRGTDARVAHWPDFEASPFDVILFTRSLHHIHPVSAAIKHASSLLCRGGLIIVEDFAFDEATPTLVEWFYGTLSLLNACGNLSLDDDSFGRRFLIGGGGMEIWFRDHDHDLNSAAIMFAGLKEYFVPLVETSAPYVYRYLCPLVDVFDNGYEIASRVLETEKRLASAGAINLIGRRFVGRKE